MRNCAVFNCRTTTSSKEYICEKLSFHCFPSNSSLKHIWMLFCRSKKPINSKTARICSKHFVSDDFLNNVQYEMGFSCKRLLKPDALPSVYVDSNESADAQIKARKSLVASLLQEESVALAAESAAEEIVIVESMEEAEESEFEEEVMEGDEFEEEEPEDDVEVIEVEEDGLEEEECINMNDIMISTEEIDDLKAKLANLKQENMCLILAGEKQKLEIQSLKRKLHQSEFHRNNMEKRLQEIFTPGQVKKFKNGSKRLQWVESDIARATALHSASPEAYELLRSKNYPLPSARTLRTWTHKSNNSESLKEKNLTNPTIIAIKRLERILTCGTSDSEDNVLEPAK